MVATFTISCDIESFKVVVVSHDPYPIRAKIRRSTFWNTDDTTFSALTELLCTSSNFHDLNAFYIQQINSVVTIVKISPILLKLWLNIWAKGEVKRSSILPDSDYYRGFVHKIICWSGVYCTKC